MPREDVRIDRLMSRHRRAVLRGEKATVRRISRLYRDIEDALLVDLRKAEFEIRELSAGGEEVPAYLLRRYGQIAEMIARAEGRLQKFADTLANDVLAQKQRSARTGAAQSGELMRVEVGGALRGLNEAAILEIAGSTAPGSPLRTLVSQIPGAAVASIERILVTGIAQGQHPSVIARRMRKDVIGDGPDGSPRALTVRRATTIARNESLRALTAGQSATYAANSDVVTGMRIVSALDRRTCPLCWARHGTILPVGDVLARHVCCRCALAPVTRYSRKRPTGDEEFAKLPAADQKRILGAGRHALYLEGMSLDSIYTQAAHPLWGPQILPRRLTDLSSEMNRRVIAEGWPSRSAGNQLVSLGSRGATPAEQSAFIRAAAEHVNALPHERLVWIVPNGEAYLLDGARDSVVVDGYEALLKDSWAIHNHPGGTGFSLLDFTAAINLDTSVFEIVSSGKRSAIERPSGGWPSGLARDIARSAAQSFEVNRRKGMSPEEATRAARAVAEKKMRKYVRKGVK